MTNTYDDYEITQEDIDFSNLPSPFESAMTLVQDTITNISGTNITTSSDMVDVLLDLQQYILKIDEGLKNAVAIWMLSRRTIDFYEENYGPVEVPEDWQPAWLADGSPI